MSDSNFYSQLYNDFQEIDGYAYREIVEFYTTNEEDIQRLIFEEYFELQIAYIDALSEISAYKNLLDECEDAIVIVIENNIRYHHGDDIYRKLLLHKALAHFNLLEYLKAEFILEQLVKIDPQDFDTIQFLKRCKIQHPPKFVQHTRSTSLVFFLFTALVICFEMSYFGFAHEPNTMATTIELSRNIIFLSGWMVLILGDGIFRYEVSKEVNQFVVNVLLEKEKKSDELVFSKK